MTDETTTAAAGTDTPAREEKTFSQEDVNRIVTERLAKDRARGEQALAEKERALQEREFALYAQERLSEQGLPNELAGALNTASREAFEEALALVLRHLGPAGNNPPRIIAPCGGAACTADPIRGAMGLAR